MTVRRQPAPAGIAAVRASATHEVLLARLRPGAGDPVGGLRRVDHDNLRRGVRYRVLVPRSADGPACPEPPVGVQVRTLPELPAELTVVDATLAMLPAGRRPGRPADLAMSRLPGVVDAVVALFEQLWSSAVPVPGGPAGVGDDPDDRERQLLALLAAGFTDESAAARLGVSVRTVRRTMSTIMARWGARSRFQAGLETAGRGVLTPAFGVPTSDTVCACAGDCHGGRRESPAGRRRVAAGGRLRG